jgi:2-C-methyl-D-erythritol 2,4-cyclodiphosphate synthase
MTPDPPLVRIGIGYDLHRLKRGGRLVLGGVNVNADFGADAHSDGDVVIHAITDALLGAAAIAADIGDLFPDADPAWKNADSRVFIEEAVRRVRESGLRPVQADVVILLERPKLGSFKDAIRRRVAELLGVEPDRVGVKAKTHEGVDAVGEGRAVACHAVVGLAAAESET